MMTMILMTMMSFANDDFMSELEASIAEEQAEDSVSSSVQEPQTVTPPVAPSFEEELSFELPSEAVRVDVSIEGPDVDANIDSDILAIDAPTIEDISIEDTNVETEMLNIESPDEIEAHNNNEADSLDWEFDTDSF